MSGSQVNNNNSAGTATGAVSYGGGYREGLIAAATAVTAQKAAAAEQYQQHYPQQPQYEQQQQFYSQPVPAQPSLPVVTATATMSGQSTVTATTGQQEQIQSTYTTTGYYSTPTVLPFPPDLAAVTALEQARPPQQPTPPLLSPPAHQIPISPLAMSPREQTTEKKVTLKEEPIRDEGRLRPALVKKRQDPSSQSVADLPSALNEIFAQPQLCPAPSQATLAEELRRTKSFAKSCADLRRVSSDDLEAACDYDYVPMTITGGRRLQPATADVQRSRQKNTFDEQFQAMSLKSKPPRPHALPQEYLNPAASSKFQYQTIHSIPERRGAKTRPRIDLMASASMSPSRLRGSSFSDSDEEYLIVTKSKKPVGTNSARVSPTRIPIPARAPPEDPRLLKARLRHTHSMFNLSEGIQCNDYKRQPSVVNLAKRHVGRNESVDPVYATVHGGVRYGSSPPVRESFLRREFSTANMIDPNDMDDYVLEELDDEEYDDEDRELANQAANFAAQYSNSWRSGSPSSSGYKTMGPYTYNAIANANDPALAKFIRERRQHQQQLQLCVVRLRDEILTPCLLDAAKERLLMTRYNVVY